MKCDWLGPGVVVCSRGQRKRCSTPGCGKVAPKLCDWKLHQVVDGKKVYTGKTCDKPMCPGCARSVGPDKDLCVPHFKQAVAAGYVKP